MEPKPNEYIVDKHLDDWIRDRIPSDFPQTCDGFSYIERYNNTQKALNPIHKDIVTGALLADIYKKLESGEVTWDNITYLNNHGPEHVKAVIEKASQVLIASKCKITAYEGYLLLMAIQFHDIGNIFGRENHEKQCMKIMQDFEYIGRDAPEKMLIAKIAAVHGGIIGEKNKDTISALEEKTNMMGQKEVRVAFLSALLRFADELADDRTRASRFLMEKDKIPNLSRIHHAYSSSLHSVIAENNRISLAYTLDANDALKKYMKNGSDIYLLDEIYSRTLKMHFEKIYCMRFLRPYVNIDSIRVEIQIYDFDEGISFNPDRFEYTLKEKGYPIYSHEDILDICPALKEWSGKEVENRLKKRKAG